MYTFLFLSNFLKILFCIFLSTRHKEKQIQKPRIVWNESGGWKRIIFTVDQLHAWHLTCIVLLNFQILWSAAICYSTPGERSEAQDDKRACRVIHQERVDDKFLSETGDGVFYYKKKNENQNRKNTLLSCSTESKFQSKGLVKCSLE